VAIIDLYDDPQSAALGGWEDLVRPAGAPIFYQTSYLTAYHRAPLGEIDRLGYLVVRGTVSGPPLAVVPVALYRYADPIGGLRVVHPGIERDPALLSHVWHCYDTRLIGATDRPEVTDAVLTALRGLAARWGARWFGFVNVDRSGATAAALTAAGMTGRHLVDRFATDLSDLCDLDDYLQRLHPRARANLRRNARRAAEAGYTTTVGPPAEADLAEIAALCGRTAERFGNSGFYPADRFVHFVESLDGAAHVLAIRQEDRLVAAGVCLVDERRFHTWTCGVDYDVAGNASPYAVLFAESVALALRLGRPVLEGGRSNEVFKRRHGLVPRHLDAYVVPL
jgi:predicted N-acyltransferase